MAGRVGVAAACRTFGVHRSTYYVSKRKIEREGLGALRPRERRRPRMPNQLSPLLEQRILAFALGHPGLGPRRVAAELARPRWGGLLVSANGVWRCLRRHGLNTRAKRLALVAGYAAPYEPPRPAPLEQHVEAERPGELVGFDCFFVGRLHNMKETIWQLTAIDVCSSYAWAELVSCKRGQPSAAQTSKLARRVAAELQRTILEECWRPAFARYLQARLLGLRRDLADYLRFYNCERAHTGRLTRGRVPAEIVYGARKMEAR